MTTHPPAHVLADTPETALLRSLLAAFDAGDIDRCVAHLHPQFRIHLAGAADVRIGPDAWLDGVSALRAGFPDVSMEIQDAFGAGDRVAIRNVIRGTHLGEFAGVPATGRTIEVASNELYRVADGLVLEEWIVTDIATLFGQITTPATK